MQTSTAERIAAATPVTRNRVVDLLRVAALSVVVLGHWLLAAVWLDDGELQTGAVLGLATWTHPVTWVFQVMPVFFLVGGYANGRSWRAARRRGEPWPQWLRARLRRLLVPVVPLLVAWVVILAVALAAGADPAMLRTASQTALVPTWFLAAYVAVCALAPLTLRVWERLGWWSVAARPRARWRGRRREPRHRQPRRSGSPTTSSCGPPCTSSATPGSTAGWAAPGGASALPSSGSSDCCSWSGSAPTRCRWSGSTTPR